MEEGITRAGALIVESEYVTCLTGAGISVESGIRPFRGPGGIWTEHGEPPLDDYQRFMKDPKAFWEAQLRGDGIGKEIADALSRAKPNPGHLALAELEKMGILKFLITQNVDNLHRAAGSKRIAEIHGNLKYLRCVRCGERFRRESVSLTELPPRCSLCGGVIKTDAVMFGEPIPVPVLELCQEETGKSDCMLLVGTSAFVYPAAGFPGEVKGRGGILIEINPYETALSEFCDVAIRGSAGEALPRLITEIKNRLG